MTYDFILTLKGRGRDTDTFEAVRSAKTIWETNDTGFNQLRVLETV